MEWEQLQRFGRRRDAGTGAETLALVGESLRTWVARRLGVAAEEAHDIASEAASAAYARFGRVPPVDETGSHLQFWKLAYQVATRRMQNFRRSETRAEAREAEWEGLRALPATPEADVERAELRHVLAYLLGRLPEESRTMFLLNNDGMPPREIAVRFGVSPRRVSDIVAQTRKQLAEALEDYRNDHLPPGYPGFVSTGDVVELPGERR